MRARIGWPSAFSAVTYSCEPFSMPVMSAAPVAWSTGMVAAASPPGVTNVTPSSPVTAMRPTCSIARPSSVLSSIASWTAFFVSSSRFPTSTVRLSPPSSSRAWSVSTSAPTSPASVARVVAGSVSAARSTTTASPRPAGTALFAPGTEPRPTMAPVASSTLTMRSSSSTASTVPPSSNAASSRTPPSSVASSSGPGCSAGSPPRTASRPARSSVSSSPLSVPMTSRCDSGSTATAEAPGTSDRDTTLRVSRS